jgi:hypothetical protein
MKSIRRQQRWSVTIALIGLATVAFPPDRPSFLRMALQLQEDGRVVVGSTLERRFIGQPPFSDWLLLRFNNSF